MSNMHPKVEENRNRTENLEPEPEIVEDSSKPCDKNRIESLSPESDSLSKVEDSSPGSML